MFCPTLGNHKGGTNRKCRDKYNSFKLVRDSLALITVSYFFFLGVGEGANKRQNIWRISLVGIKFEDGSWSILSFQIMCCWERKTSRLAKGIARFSWTHLPHNKKDSSSLTSDRKLFFSNAFDLLKRTLLYCKPDIIKQYKMFKR